MSGKPIPERKNKRDADGKFLTVYLFDTPYEQGVFQAKVEAALTAPPPSVPEWLNSLRGEALGRLAQDEWMGNHASYPAWGNLSEDERAVWVAVGERIKTAMLAAAPALAQQQEPKS